MFLENKLKKNLILELYIWGLAKKIKNFTYF